MSRILQSKGMIFKRPGVCEQLSLLNLYLDMSVSRQFTTIIICCLLSNNIYLSDNFVFRLLQYIDNTDIFYLYEIYFCKYIFGTDCKELLSS